MTVADVAFYVFAIILLAAGLSVVLARSPVHSVLWLILAFFSATGLFVLLGAEFVAMLLIFVYVGAVAVLFLFVVMMLDIDFRRLKAEIARYVPVAALIAAVILVQLGLALGDWTFSEQAEAVRSSAGLAGGQANTQLLGELIYDDYLLPFQLAGLILLVAMIGAILLTLRHRENVKRQNVLAQMYRDPAASMELRDVKSGQGL